MKKLIALALLLGCGVAQVGQAAQFTKTIVMGDSLSEGFGDPNDWVTHAPAWYYLASRNESRSSRCMGDLTSDGAPDMGIAALADGWLIDHPEADSVIIFAGVNDISSYNRSNGIQLFNDLQASVNVIKTYPNIKDVVVVTPIPFGAGPGRFGYERAQEYMALAEPYCAADPLLHCFDAWEHMEDPERTGFQKPGYTDGVDETHTIEAGAIALEAGITAFIETNVIDAPSVEISIKPGGEVNLINTKSKGVILVAILGSDTLDVMTIDTSTLVFGPEGAGTATPKHKKGGQLENVNDDEWPDLVSYYPTQDSNLTSGDTEACVSGELYDGAIFEACDAVVIK